MTTAGLEPLSEAEADAHTYGREDADAVKARVLDAILSRSGAVVTARGADGQLRRVDPARSADGGPAPFVEGSILWVAFARRGDADDEERAAVVSVADGLRLLSAQGRRVRAEWLGWFDVPRPAGNVFGCRFRLHSVGPAGEG